MHLEILKHSGPARLGLLHLDGQEIPTPNFFSVLAPGIAVAHDVYIASEDFKTDKRPLILNLKKNSKFSKFGIMPDLRVGFDVPREIAEASVGETIKLSGQKKEFGAVIQGSKFLDLRIECAEKLKDRPLLVIANGSKLVDNPRLLVDIVTKIRETISPNTALYFPSAPPYAFHLLAYMGIDLFDSLECVTKAREKKMATHREWLELQNLKEIPCTCSACKNKKPDDMADDFESILAHNFNVALQVTREIREAVRDNSFRELVEEKASCNVNLAVMLRLLDREKREFLEKYTPIF